MDPELGSQSIQDYGFRIYNPAIAKFLSVDPLTQSYPWYTPYQFAGNMPILAIDIDGAEPLLPDYATMVYNAMVTKLKTMTSDAVDYVVSLPARMIKSVVDDVAEDMETSKATLAIQAKIVHGVQEFHLTFLVEANAKGEIGAEALMNVKGIISSQGSTYDLDDGSAEVTVGLGYSLEEELTIKNQGEISGILFDGAQAKTLEELQEIVTNEIGKEGEIEFAFEARVAGEGAAINVTTNAEASEVKKVKAKVYFEKVGMVTAEIDTDDRKLTLSGGVSTPSDKTGGGFSAKGKTNIATFKIGGTNKKE